MPCPAPQHTNFRRGTPLHELPDRGGHGAEKVTSLIHRVLFAVVVAPCPQFCEQGLPTFLHMGGTGRRAIAYCTKVRSIWCEHSPFLLRLDRQGPRIDPCNTEVHTWLVYPIRRRALPKYNYALSVPLQPRDHEQASTSRFRFGRYFAPTPRILP